MDSAPTQDNIRAVRQGTLENPEIVENVPGHFIPVLLKEYDDFKSEAQTFLEGDLEETEFIKFRLKQGVYGQRQPDGPRGPVQMIRVKLPVGVITPEQMEAFADAIEKYVPLKKGHITTRQCIQVHHVPLPDAEKYIRDISEAGLSSREGCGNTVRNVTGDPRAGTLKDEPFDPTPYAGAYVRYFVRHPTTQAMPRKWKTAFSANADDNAITLIHDCGFVPVVRDGVRGFRMVIGGGTSIMPRKAIVVSEFVEADNGDYLKLTEACVRIFDRQDFLRVNRARARIKVLIDKIGAEEFRQLVEEELKGDWVNERNFDPKPLFYEVDEEATAPAPRPTGYASPNGDLSEFQEFHRTNVQAQRQEGFSTVEINVRRGDLTVEQFRALAELTREYAGGWARTTIHQNLVLRWVRDESVYELWTELKKLELADPGAQEIVDNVSCPGTDSCKLGITSSMGLNQAINDRLHTMNITDPLSRKIHIKNSGCPNGCGQHHIANIGFYGASIKVGEHTIPAYIAHVGGQYEDGVEFGARLKARLPAKRVPEAVDRWVRYYESERNDGEEFNAFAARVGTAGFEAQVKDLSMPVEFSLENLNYFIDWTKDTPFEVQRGEGECAV